MWASHESGHAPTAYSTRRVGFLPQTEAMDTYRVSAPYCIVDSPRRTVARVLRQIAKYIEGRKGRQTGLEPRMQQEALLRSPMKKLRGFCRALIAVVGLSNVSTD